MEGKAAVTCDRVWLLYLQGRLSPAQLLALCKVVSENRLSAENNQNNAGQQSSAA
ncbi:hypothetical protein Lepto7375DRAFT_6411 [Leptolyngbya sp. PCC 7375]|nr:hypothetical protein Lepto7375DRAFT_6411 [Leptolyngbya sp. PCC 7375]